MKLLSGRLKKQYKNIQPEVMEIIYSELNRIQNIAVENAKLFDKVLGPENSMAEHIKEFGTSVTLPKGVPFNDRFNFSHSQEKIVAISTQYEKGETILVKNNNGDDEDCYLNECDLDTLFDILDQLEQVDEKNIENS